MESEIFNMSMRKFLKQVGVTSQQKIEEAIRNTSATRSLTDKKLEVEMTLTIPKIGLVHTLNGDILLKAET